MIRFNNFIKKYEVKCKTCNTKISIESAYNEHINHDVRIRLTTKHWILDILMNTLFAVSITLLVYYFVFSPKLEELITICQNAMGIRGA